MQRRVRIHCKVDLDRLLIRGRGQFWFVVELPDDPYAVLIDAPWALQKTLHFGQHIEASSRTRGDDGVTPRLCDVGSRLLRYDRSCCRHRANDHEGGHLKALAVGSLSRAAVWLWGGGQVSGWHCSRCGPPGFGASMQSTPLEWHAAPAPSSAAVSFRSSRAFAAPAWQPMQLRRSPCEDVCMDDDAVAGTVCDTAMDEAVDTNCDTAEPLYNGDCTSPAALNQLYEDTRFPELNVWAALAAEQHARLRPPLTVQNSTPARALGKRSAHEVASAHAQDVKRCSSSSRV